VTEASLVLPAPDRDRLAALFTDLASLRSPSRRERGVADYVVDLLGRLGLTVTEDDTGTRIGGDAGNLLCRVEGQGRPALALAAHMDTVLPTDEIEPVLEEGRFRNRRPTILGSDDKVAVTALLHATELLLAAGEPFPTYEMAFTVAEEIGLLGAKHLPADWPQSPLGAVFDSSGAVGGIIVKAPSHNLLRATFRGRPAHAGLEPEKGRNAIQAAARAITRMQLGRLDEETTANLGTIHGGTATNIVADRCTLEAECRSHDPAKLARVAAALVDACELGATETGVDVDLDLSSEYQAFSLSARAPVVRLSRAAVAALGLPSRLLASGGGSDASVLNARGVSTVNLDCGMTAVHTPDESVSLDDLERVTLLTMAMIRLAPQFAGG